MTEKVDFTNYLPEEENKSVDISEVKDVSEASNRFLKIESDILALEDQVKRKKAELMQMNDSIVQLMESRGVKEINKAKPNYKLIRCLDGMITSL